jgi:hypothetical protein
MKMKFICPECQNTFKETSLSEDFNTKCPHCGAEVSIPADPAKVEKARKEAEEKEAAEKKEAEQKAKEKAEQAAARKLEEENAKAVGLVGRSVTRICPHCQHESSYKVIVEPGVESFVVRCGEYGCKKNFTILNASEDMITPLADILKELEVIRYRVGALVFWFIVIPLLCLALIAIIQNLPK